MAQDLDRAAFDAATAEAAAAIAAMVGDPKRSPPPPVPEPAKKIAKAEATNPFWGDLAQGLLNAAAGAIPRRIMTEQTAQPQPPPTAEGSDSMPKLSTLFFIAAGVAAVVGIAYAVIGKAKE